MKLCMLTTSWVLGTQIHPNEQPLQRPVHIFGLSNPSGARVSHDWNKKCWSHKCERGGKWLTWASERTYRGLSQKTGVKH